MTIIKYKWFSQGVCVNRRIRIWTRTSKPAPKTSRSQWRKCVLHIIDNVMLTPEQIDEYQDDRYTEPTKDKFETSHVYSYIKELPECKHPKQRVSQTLSDLEAKGYLTSILDETGFIPLPKREKQTRKKCTQPRKARSDKGGKHKRRKIETPPPVFEEEMMDEDNIKWHAIRQAERDAKLKAEKEGELEEQRELEEIAIEIARQRAYLKTMKINKKRV